MRYAWRISLFLVLLISIGLFANVAKDPNGDVPLVDKKKISEQKEIKTNPTGTTNYEKLSRPKEGISSWIGKTADALRKKYGEPSRIDETEYEYQWWVYNEDVNNYFQFAIANGKVVSSVGAGKNAVVVPFRIGQSINDMYTLSPIEGNVELEWQGTHYRFELTEQEFYTRPLIKVGELYAQLYFDRFNGELSMVRYMDTQTLVYQKPYELTYSGMLDEPIAPNALQWEAIDRGKELQIIDLTNVIRNQFDLPSLIGDDTISQVSRAHSRDMYEKNYFSHVSPEKQDLAGRLTNGKISYLKAGENIAAQYVDSVAVMEGWLNSKEHRSELLSKDFSLLGAGVFHGYYTQNFVEPISTDLHD